MKRSILFSAVLVLLLAVTSAIAQTSSFTYQGRFTESGTPATGTYDMQFKLFDGAGTQIGATISNGVVQVSSGVFTVQLDYGAAAFSGADRFLEIGVRSAGSGDPYTVLAPRQPLTSAVYAIRAGTTTTADNANQLGGVAADQYVQANDTRLTDSRSPTAGSSNYIQNTANAQTGNFNISGNGTAGGTLSANIANAITQYNLGGTRFLRADVVSRNTLLGLGAGGVNLTGHDNVFVGRLSGSANTTGDYNTFTGSFAGINNTTGGSNSAFGAGAGENNTTGHANALFGYFAGGSNKTGSFNSFFGGSAGGNNENGFGNSFFGNTAGFSNVDGTNNSFFGMQAGYNNTAINNSFFGSYAGYNNTSGQYNSFFGYRAGFSNTLGTDNMFFGPDAGSANQTGSHNTVFGSSAGRANLTDDNSYFGYLAGFTSTGANNSFFGSKAGVANTTGYANSFFGKDAGISNKDGATNAFFGYSAGAGTTTGSDNSFFGTNSGRSNQTGTENSFFGNEAGYFSTGSKNSFIGNKAGFTNFAGADNVFVGASAGENNQSGNQNTFVGLQAGNTNSTGDKNTVIGHSADVGSAGLNYATAIGADAVVTTSNTIVLGRSNGSDGVRVPGALSVSTLGAGGITSLCRNPLNQISTCSSSLRYKTNLQPFTGGLFVLNRLKPITFDWKDGGSHDLGFGAEDVAAIEPLLVTRNDKGEVEGVKYDRISAVLVNAVKEQQEQIKQQQLQLAQQQKQIADLQRLVLRKPRRVRTSH